ncbi:hypothetical protein BUALT_Bualt09G0111000 [Buddleja alternifolia]|uniref:WD repeat-containing protein 44 n=1 Tax=Buddleja alternifolia TaxID=168488 RepID=A0AAV6X1P6_9LAMI|nr:hypothetical protein BUALT_Bualt09G0111000 [Buddleja alternifolia]
MTHRRTLTMNLDGLGEDNDDEDRFFESLDSDDDFEDFEDSRMSFVSSASIKRIYPFEPITKSSSIVLPSYDMWMAEPGDVKERRKRLLQGLGLTSNKDLLSRLVTSKFVRAISRKPEPEPENAKVSVPSQVDNNSSPAEESRIGKPEGSPKPEPEIEPSPSPKTVIVLVRSRSDGDLDAFSAKTKQRKEELIGPISKQRLTRTSSGQLVQSIGVCQYLSAPKTEKNKPQTQNNDVLLSDGGAFGSFFLIKNLDTGNEFIVKESNEQGMWNKLNEVQTGKQLTMEEFEKSVGYSPVVKELMRRASKKHEENGGKVDYNSYFTKSFRNSKRKGAAFLKNIKGVATSMSGLLADREQEHSLLGPVDERVMKNASQWVEARQQGKSYKEFTALHLSQEIQAHEGSIWTMKFSSDGRFLASAGEDKNIHVWEVQECEVMPMRTSDDSSSGSSSASGTPVHPMAGIASDRPPVAEILPMPLEKRKKGAKKSSDSIPEYLNVPETVLALSEKPICTFKGHKEDVLDLSWSKSQLLLSSSMDKTVKMWDLETKTCLKTFVHNDYVTCIQFNPVDDDFFISGSLDAKVRIWNTRDRKVVDWKDFHEMVTAISYTPNGQGAIIGSHEGSCRTYSIEESKMEHSNDIPTKKKPQAKIFPGFQSPAKKTPGVQSQAGKITGFEFAPWNPSEVLITSTESRVEIYNGSELTQKYRGSRNTSSQISASFTPDGKHIITASEDSHVYIWKVEESKNLGNGKRRSRVTVHAHEHFPCKDVSVAIPWPGSIKNEPPIVEIHSKRHSKRSTAPPRDDNLIGESKRNQLPPLPKKIKEFDRITSCMDEDFAQSSRIDPGIGVTESFASSSASIGYSDSDSASISSASGTSPSQSWSSGNGGQTVQATAWGLVIVTASLEGEIRVYQNFGLPVKVSRQTYLF